MSEEPPKPVPNPDLPVTGDPDDFELEPIEEVDFNPQPEAMERPGQPNDLSGIEKEFTD